MFRLQKLLGTVAKPNTNVLGRWGLESCDKKINSKIDWSNTDHCGTCSYEELEETSKNRHLENTNKTRSLKDDGSLHIHRSLTEMNKETPTNSK
jgi:hypothetical protein